MGGVVARTAVSIGDPQSSLAFYHADAMGNLTALLDTNQRIVARYLYDPFGNVLAKSGLLAGPNLYRFSSKEWHEQSGFVYYLYRYYEPNLQRWTTRDPAAKANDINIYCFVNNAPIIFIDY